MLTFPHSAEAVSVTYQSDFVLSRAYFFSNKQNFFSYQDMFRITVIPLRDRQICWQLILTVGIRNCHPIRRHENYRLSSSNLFRFSLERTFRTFCFVFISIIGVSVSQWNESIYVNGVERLGCRTLRKIQISFRLFIFLLFIDISLLIPSRPFARSYLWSVPLSEFREEFENWKFFFI